MNTTLFNMIAEGEHQQQDFKYCINDSRKIARSLVAFANSDGGRLLLGVRDNGSIAGVKSDEEYYMIEAAAKLYSKPPIPFQTRQWHSEGKSVLEIIVAKSDERPFFVKDESGKWLVYIRKHDKNILAPKILIEIWKRQKSHIGVSICFTNDEKKLLGLLENLQQLSLSQYARLLKIPRWKAEKILINLIVVKVVGIEIDEKGTRFFLRDDFVRKLD